ncbi:MAG TPA: menaquinone biosynthesis protein [Bryobacteraceae bacterium]|nr:menaquinone biosynthesis protein [Bryobacteraceae bacterium]HOQ46177.1 menaquinone biosynthesis protein [Bryobacteraceae bacterium]HPQ14911.1 menaquinone biosynthesis protein [Bryobacteraceae bacterium]HPU72682.1 menaquinone biosynthesis protein [Bryobacteraceae bacterium]
MTHQRKPRVCAVSYLNTAPLIWGMLHGSQRDCFELDFSLPSECADKLASGTADIGVVPSIEVARQGLGYLRGAGIASHGEVRSILLVSKVPPAEIRTLAADTSSRTSVALARIVLSRRYGAQPEMKPMPPDLPSMLEATDAALLIGDPALRVWVSPPPLAVYDLGAEWVAMTGLPMVFAVWGGRKEFITPGMEAAFLESCRFGRARLAEIARCEGPPRGFSEAFALEYLERNIVNELGEREYEGMRLFHQYARELGILAPVGGARA